MTPRKHAKLIKAWADGAEIEYRWLDQSAWCSSSALIWREECEYRIKPKPDVVTFDCLELDDGAAAFAFGKDNLKLTWCGETGKLKLAEVV